ncbi:MAG: hypothetical protein K2X62_02575 [Beijerinckiaceae bacterium]|jgi:hypothetical protein|nr:hypothetical protein [Beijerinckiaceae bacterium]
MKDSYVDHESARRHFGVALIDLSYAASELERCAIHGRGLVAEQSRIASHLLAEELTRLRDLGAYIYRIGQAETADHPPATNLERWWPKQMRPRQVEK